MSEKYKTKATRGVRSRPSCKFSLDPKTSRSLDVLARRFGMTRSRVLDRLVADAERATR